MRNLKLVTSILVLLFTLSNVQTTAKTTLSEGKKPVIIEFVTSHKSVKEALMDVKNKLLMQKFITENSIGENGFTAKRTTGSDSDYYIADVVAVKQEGQVKITITFMKIGSGMLKLKKVAAKIKANYE